MIAAVAFDVRCYRIPNLLILAGIIYGVTFSIYTAGWTGLAEALAGIGIPIVLLFLLYQLRVLGAGDIKLFAVVGGVIGPVVWRVMLYSFAAGGVLAAVQMFYHHNLVSRMKWFWNYIRTCFRTRQIFPYESGFDKGDTKNTIHFSAAILIGYCSWLIERWVTG